MVTKGTTNTSATNNVNTSNTNASANNTIANNTSANNTSGNNASVSTSNTSATSVKTDETLTVDANGNRNTNVKVDREAIEKVVKVDNVINDIERSKIATTVTGSKDSESLEV